MTVLGGTGHQDIPDEARDHVVAAIRSEVARHDPAGLVGVTSLAVGADQLFARAILEASARLHVVVPCQGYETTFDDTDLRSYEDLLAAATTVETLPYPRPSEDAFLAAGRRVVDLADVLVAVWDGDQARSKGGTGDVVTYAERTGTKVLVVWPDGVSRRPN